MGPTPSPEYTGAGTPREGEDNNPIAKGVWSIPDRGLKDAPLAPPFVSERDVWRVQGRVSLERWVGNYALPSRIVDESPCCGSDAPNGRMTEC